MSGVELSSNWKRLQATLQKDKPNANTSCSAPTRAISGGLKRKRVLPEVSNNHKRINMSDARSAAPVSSPLPVKLPPSITTALTTSEKNAGVITGVKAGRYLALDCEMVSTTMDSSRLARVSMVNYHLETIYDSFVCPEAKDPVVDYRTPVSGIRPQDLRHGYARSIQQVRQDVARLLNGRVLVGHALRNDLEALDMRHPGAAIRDTTKCAVYRGMAGGRSPALRDLSQKILGVAIQGAEHCSVVDARAAMELYKREKRAMDDDVRKKYGGMIHRQGSGALKGVLMEPERTVEGEDSGEEETTGDITASSRQVLDGETDGEKQGPEGEGERELQPKKKNKKKKRKHKSRTTRA